MRKIKFRGKRIDNNEWVYGLIISIGEKYSTIRVIYPKYTMSYRVKTETIGQFSGLKDKNRKESYDGDIYQTIYESRIRLSKYKIFWSDNEARWKSEREDGYIYDFTKTAIEKCEIIGNIFENPELLSK